MKKICKSCGCQFTPVPTVPDQEYCRKTKCQRTRQSRWQKNKRATDKAYGENQRDAQKAWQRKNKDYWKKYRKQNPAYTERNRENQKLRNQKRKMQLTLPDFVKSEIAKMDPLTAKKRTISGYYKLIPIQDNEIAKMDVLMVKIDVITKY